MTPETAQAAPKVLLHDHLDGGLRPQTIIDLAEEVGYAGLPTDDADSCRTWFRQSFAAPTEVQRRGWERIASGRHTLMLAPTGSG